MKQFLARDGAGFQKHVALDYGPVVKLAGYLGVRLSRSPIATTAFL